MPTYDYQCDACQHRFELFQSINDSPKKKCPECGRNRLRRLFGTGAAIVFKGSGFYQTDYRSDSYRKAAEAEKKQTAGSEGAATDKKVSASEKSGGETKSSGESSKSKPAKKKPEALATS